MSRHREHAPAAGRAISHRVTDHGSRRFPARAEDRSRHAADRRRAARDRRGRHQIRRTAPTCCLPLLDPAPRSPACSPSRNARPRRSSGAAPSSRAARRARWWSIPATPMPSPASDGRAAAQFTAQLAAKALGCTPTDIFLASTGVIGEPLKASRFDGVMEDLAARAAPDGLARRRQGDHDHRHLPQGRDRDGQARQGDGHHQRHRQGRRHDRARHGDDAVLRLHRRADRARAPCRRCSRTASPTPSTP